MKTKNNLWIILIAIAALLAIYYIFQKNGEPGVIKIGAILPLTGDAALAGQYTKQGIDLASKYLEENEILRDRIQVIFEDTKGEPKTGITVVQKLIDVDKVQFIIDNSLSTITLAVAPIVESNKVILLSTGASSPEITDAGQYIFRIWNSDNYEGEVIASFVKDSLKLKSIGVLYLNSDFGLGLKNTFEKNLFNSKINVFYEAFNPNESNFRTILSKLINNNPEVIYLIGYTNESIKIIRQAKELGFKGFWIGTSVMLDPSFNEILNSTNYKLYYPSPEKPDSTSEYYKVFNTLYKNSYNQQPVPLSDVGFDALILYAKALKNNKLETGELIKDYFLNMKTYFGASGEIKFDKNGDVNKKIRINSIN